VLWAVFVVVLGTVGWMMPWRSAVAAHGAARPVAPGDAAPQQAADALDSMVARATALYQQRQYARAADLFAQTLQQRPDDVDLLANWGAAAWAAGDTVAAVVAWHRAARLEPVAMDLQERLLSLPVGARSGVAEVPMVPVPALVVVALVLWLLGWLLLARIRLSHGRDRLGAQWSRGSSVALGSLLLAIVAGATAAWGMQKLDASRLYVVRQPDTMRGAPGAEANALGGVATGDVMQVDELREGWIRGQHADGRRGWLPAERTVPLVSPAVFR
jgi:hypothetical protein